MTQMNTPLTITNGTAQFSMTQDQILNDTPTREGERPLLNPAQQAWRDAIAFVTLRAKDHYGAELHGRLDKAQALVLEGHVTLDEGAARVTSETAPDKRYTVNGTCHCPDSKSQRTPGSICKHRLAVAIHKRAYQEAKYLLDLRRAAAHSADDSAAAPAMPESPVSMNTHITIDHRQIQVTVRTGATSDDYHRVLTVMQEVLAQHPATAALPTAEAPQAPLCPLHQTPMRPSKFGGHYCPRKNEDGGHCKETAA